MLPATLKRGFYPPFARRERALATGKKPENQANHPTGNGGKQDASDADLDRRRSELDVALANIKEERKEAAKGMNRSGNMTGVAYALRLSSEFIAAIVVGTAIGWLIDKVAGTGPWGLIIFLLLGFAAGILNVLRSAGLIAVAKSERGVDLKPSDKIATPPGNAWKDDEED